MSKNYKKKVCFERIPRSNQKKKSKNTNNLEETSYLEEDISILRLGTDIEQKVIQFNIDTLPYSKFHIEDVAPDNACFFRACANQYNFRYGEHHDSDDELFNTDPSKVIGDTSWSYCGNLQTYLAREFQEYVRDYICSNPDDTFMDTGLSISNFISLTHGIEGDTPEDVVRKYSRRYKHFAGDIIDYDEDIETDDENDDDNKYNCGWNHIGDRWGSSLEAYALSKDLNVNVNIYTLQEIDTDTGEIMLAQVKYGDRIKLSNETNARFRLIQSFKEEECNPTFHLLYDCNPPQHYMSLYPLE